MTRWWIALCGALVLVGVALGLPLARLDRSAISRLAAERASQALGRQVELGAVHIGLFPLGVRIADVRVAGDPGAPLLAQIDAVELGLAIVPLLSGRLELRSLSLDRPRIALGMTPDGVVVLPARAAAAPPATRLAEPRGPASAASLTIDRFSIRGGELSAGSWQLRELHAEGGLDAQRSVSAALSAQIAGIGRIADGRLQIDAIGSGAPRVQAEGALRDVDLAALVRAVPALASQISVGRGQVAGSFSFELEGAQLRAGRAQLAADEVDLRAGSLELRGGVRAELALGERFSIDLGPARVSVPGVLQKPAGERLALSGALGRELSAAAFGNAVLALGSAELPLSLELASRPPALRIGRAELALASVKGWLQGLPSELGGKLRSDELRVALAPLRVTGALQLDGIALQRRGTRVALSGALRADARRLQADALTLDVADQRLSASATYELASGELNGALSAQGVDAEKLLRSLRDLRSADPQGSRSAAMSAAQASELGGSLDARLELHGPADVARLRGSGELSLAGARLLGPALIEAFRSPPVNSSDTAASAVAEPPPGLQRWLGAEQRFERLSARFSFSPEHFQLESFSVRGGQLASGAWPIRDLFVDGQLDARGTVSALVSALVDGIGRVEDGRVTAEALDSDAPRVRVEGRLRDADLAALLRALPSPPKAIEVQRGRVAGPFSLELAGSQLRAAHAEWAADELDVHASSLAIGGTAKAELALGERFALDLGPARVSIAGLEKPAGERLELSGPLAAELSPTAMHSAVLALGSAQIPISLDFSADSPRIEVARSELDLASMHRWFDAAPGETRGKIRSDGLRISLAPLRVEGALQLDGASWIRKGTALSLSGAVKASGARLSADALSVAVGEQKLALTGGYDLDAGELDARLSAQAVDTEKLVAGLLGRSDITGTLGARISWSGPLGLAQLRGVGEFDIADGRIRGFSLVRQLLGQVTELGAAATRARGGDLSRFEEEQFQRLSGRFKLAPGRVDLESLALEYRHASADLRGTVGLPGGELELRGDLAIRRELGEELAGDPNAPVQEEVIPIEGVGGTVSQPRLVLGRKSVALLAARYAAQGRLGEKLKEKLGKEEGEALQSVLDDLLGNRKRNTAAEPRKNPPAAGQPGPRGKPKPAAARAPAAEPKKLPEAQRETPPTPEPEPSAQPAEPPAEPPPAPPQADPTPQPPHSDPAD